MTDIFISYKREEREQARRLAEALGARGFSVWWDADILPGEQYRAVTLRILENCRAAIVIWSPLSTGSSWVLDEAQRALDRGVLVPVHLEPIASYPLGFGQVHAHNLVGWDGTPEDAKLKPVLAAIGRLAPPRAEVNNDAEVAFWRGIQGSINAGDYQAYLAKYGDAGLFAALARERVNALTPRSMLPPLPPVPPPRPPVALSPPLTRWELGFVASVLALAGFVLWPLAKVVTGNEAFELIDYTSMFLLGYAQNVFVMTALLTGLAWVFDRAAAWCAPQPSPVRYAALVLPPLILLGLVLFTLWQRDQSYDDNAYYVAGEMAHFYLWIAAAWGAALIARKATPRFKHALQSIGLFKS